MATRETGDDTLEEIRSSYSTFLSSLFFFPSSVNLPARLIPFANLHFSSGRGSVGRARGSRDLFPLRYRFFFLSQDRTRLGYVMRQIEREHWNDTAGKRFQRVCLKNKGEERRGGRKERRSEAVGGGGVYEASSSNCGQI